MKTYWAGLIIICTGLWIASTARAQEFSAIGVARDTTGHVVKSKVRVSGKKVRYDPQETGAANEQAYSIFDLAQRSSTVINVGRRSYTQKPADRLVLQMYASGDSPCPPAGATCKHAGTETLNGRAADKWEISQTVQGQTLLTRVWVDTKLHVWTKVEVLAGSNLVFSNELQDIQEGPQPASLFVVPADYAK